jgi:transcriptional regulator with PAS, ATPase and Fis domain
VFLDEIGDLPMSIQPKLLQAVEEHRFIPVGGTASTHSDMRIISATNQDLSSLVRAGRFRSDLLYRLSVLNITIPPLRQRKKEIPEYVEHFMNRLHQKYGVNKRLNPGAMGTLLEYDWPGNLRELQHVLEYLVLTSPKPMIDEENLPEHLRRKRSCAAPAPDKGEKYSRQSLIDLYDKTHSTYRVAKAVGLSQSTVYRLIGDYVKESRGRA